MRSWKGGRDAAGIHWVEAVQDPTMLRKAPRSKELSGSKY